MTLRGVIGALLVLASVSRAGATEAVVSTRVCEPLAKRVAVQLSPAEDTALYLPVDKRLRAALVAAGHSVAADAPIELYFSVSESPVEIRRGGPSLGSLEVRTVRREQRALLLLNVWSTTQDSVLGGQKTKATSRITNYLLMAVELSRRDNGRCVWRGEGAADLAGWDSARLAERLADAIMRYLGRAADQERVVLE